MRLRVSAVLGLLILFLSGCVISPRRDVSSGGGGGGGTPTGKLYVTLDSGNAILRFDNALTATGNVPPAAIISGTATLLLSPRSVALDIGSDRLFVADPGANAVLVFDNISTKNGNIAPTRTIAGASTNLISPIDLALDGSRNLLYVADGGNIVVFSSASSVSGNQAPARIITPSPAFNVSGIFLDAATDRLFVSDATTGAEAIKVFDNASSLNNSVTAVRTIAGGNTQLGQPGNLIVDSAGRLIVSNFSPPKITVYSNAATTSGNVTPLGAVTSTDMGSPSQIALNAANSDLYVADTFSARVVVFANIGTANGNVSANRNINGSSTQLGTVGITEPRGVALDTTR